MCVLALKWLHSGLVRRLRFFFVTQSPDVLKCHNALEMYFLVWCDFVLFFCSFPVCFFVFYIRRLMLRFIVFFVISFFSLEVRVIRFFFRLEFLNLLRHSQIEWAGILLIHHGCYVHAYVDISFHTPGKTHYEWNFDSLFGIFLFDAPPFYSPSEPELWNWIPRITKKYCCLMVISGSSTKKNTLHSRSKCYGLSFHNLFTFDQLAKLFLHSIYLLACGHCFSPIKKSTHFLTIESLFARFHSDLLFKI